RPSATAAKYWTVASRSRDGALKENGSPEGFGKRPAIRMPSNHALYGVRRAQVLRSWSLSGSLEEVESVTRLPAVATASRLTVSVVNPLSTGAVTSGLFSALEKFRRPPVVLDAALGSLSGS